MLALPPICQCLLCARAFTGLDLGESTLAVAPSLGGDRIWPGRHGSRGEAEEGTAVSVRSGCL